VWRCGRAVDSVQIPISPSYASIGIEKPLDALQNSSGNRVIALSKPHIFVNLNQSKSIASSCKSFKINRLGVFFCFGKLAWGATVECSNHSVPTKNTLEIQSLSGDWIFYFWLLQNSCKAPFLEVGYVLVRR